MVGHTSGMQRTSKNADLEAIIGSLEKRLDSLEIRGLASDTEGLGTQMLSVRQRPRRNEQTYESADAEEIYYGKYWDRLLADFAKDISGPLRLRVVNMDDLNREEYHVSHEFKDFILRKFELWRANKRRRGESITNQTRPGGRPYNPNDDRTGEHYDGLMSERDRWRNSSTTDGTRLPKGYRSEW
jgi:hypothetical protein